MAINYTALKTDIQANTDQTVIDALAAGATNTIAGWYNQTASPAYHVYRNSDDKVTVDEIRAVINAQNIVDITAADLDRVMALLDLRAELGFRGDVASDRSAWSDAFSAAAGDESQQAILALWTKTATYAEEVHALSTGTGADAANADTTSWQGTLSSGDVNDALNS